MTGAGGAGHQEIDDLHVIVETEAEAGLVLAVKGVEDRATSPSVKVSVSIGISSS